MLMAELTPDATKAMNMRANGERPWSFHDSFDVCRNDRLLLLQHSDALSARLAEAERDAARYRWLRANNSLDGKFCISIEDDDDPSVVYSGHSPIELDGIIDAVMERR